MPAQLSEAQLKVWLMQHPGDYGRAFFNGPPGQDVQSIGAPGSGPPSGAAQVRRSIDRNITTICGEYSSS